MTTLESSGAMLVRINQSWTKVLGNVTADLKGLLSKHLIEAT